MTPDTLGIATIVRTLNDGGATFYPDGQPFQGDQGYVVGGFVPTLKLDPSKITGSRAVSMLRQFVYTHSPELVGTWVDPDDGRVHVDSVRVVPSLGDALTLARANHEKAVWDLANQQTINARDARAPDRKTTA